VNSKRGLSLKLAVVMLMYAGLTLTGCGERKSPTAPIVQSGPAQSAGPADFGNVPLGDAGTAPLTVTASTRKGFMLATLNDLPTLSADVARLADLHATIVRFPIYFSFEPSLTAWFQKLDAILDIAEARGVTVVIDIHHPGATQGSTITSVADFVAKWDAISTRYAARTGHLWYDLCNEPNAANWGDIALRAAQTIRRHDTRHSIVYAVKGTTTSPLATVTPLPGIAKQIIEAHFYNWSGLQFGTTIRYPSTNRTKADLVRILDDVAAARARTGLNVYIGEVAINRDHPDAARFLNDFTSLCDARGIDLTVHAYREAAIWNYEPTPAWPVLLAWLAR